MDEREIARLADEVVAEFRVVAEEEEWRPGLEKRYRALEDLGMWDVLEMHRAASGETEQLDEAWREVQRLEENCRFMLDASREGPGS